MENPETTIHPLDYLMQGLYVHILLKSIFNYVERVSLPRNAI